MLAVVQTLLPVGVLGDPWRPSPQFPARGAVRHCGDRFAYFFVSSNDTGPGPFGCCLQSDEWVRVAATRAEIEFIGIRLEERETGGQLFSGVRHHDEQ